MEYKYKRNFKNYLINKDFQIKFLLRFFVYTFLVLTFGALIQYYFSTRTVLNELSQLNKEAVEQQKRLYLFKLNNPTKIDYKVLKMSQEAERIVQYQFDAFENMLDNEIKIKDSQLNHTGSIVKANKTDQMSALLLSVFIVGLIVNLLLAFGYGIFLTHRLAGNHYRLQKFAKQLQDRDLSSPLIVRTKDFFQETAKEFERARFQLSGDFQRLSNKDYDVIRQYRF